MLEIWMEKLCGWLFTSVWPFRKDPLLPYLRRADHAFALSVSKQGMGEKFALVRILMRKSNAHLQL